MAQLSWEDFIDYVKEWVNKNEDKIKTKWPQKGGWEGWAQAEIASFIIEKNSTYEIEREQHVYTTQGKAADFLLNNLQSDVKKKVVVELKCQSLENYTNFKGGLENDIKKLTKELKPEYRGATLIVLGIYFTEHKGIPGYFDNKICGTGEVGICWAIDPGN